MLIVERQQRVLQILRERKAAELEELARELEVSVSTIRRDLESLERKGAVERTHGGAVFRGESSSPAVPAVNGEPPLPAAQAIAASSQPGIVLAELVDTLYTRRLMAGNRSDYYDPRNSFLNDVLDRGVGIPLTLGIVLLETGWRLGLPLEGVNFPGHFLIRFRGAEFALLIDPFDGGKIRFEDEAQELLDQVYGGVVRLQETFLRTASKRTA